MPRIERRTGARHALSPLVLFAALLALALMAACGGDDDSTATPNESGNPSTTGQASGSPLPSGTPAATPAGSEGAPAVCTQEDAQRGTITTLDFNKETGAYDSGDSIDMTFTIANCGDNEITLHFPTAQRYVVTAQDSLANEVWSSDDKQVFDQVQGQEVLPPNKTIVYTQSWDQKDSAGQQVPDGQYKISAFSVGCTSAQSGCHFGPIRFVQIGEVQPAAS